MIKYKYTHKKHRLGEIILNNRQYKIYGNIAMNCRGNNVYTDFILIIKEIQQFWTDCVATLVWPCKHSTHHSTTDEYKYIEILCAVLTQLNVSK